MPQVAVLADQPNPTKRMLILFTSWGLSGALVQDGKILSGRDSLIGEIGHMILDPRDTEACSCGSYGCLERLVSIARLRKRISTDPPPAAERKERKAAPEEIPLRLLFSTFELIFDIYIICLVKHLHLTNFITIIRRPYYG